MVAFLSPLTPGNGFLLVALSSPSYWQVFFQILIVPLLIVALSWHTNLGKLRESSLVEIYLTHLPMSWPTITTPFVGLSYCQMVNSSQLLLLGSYDHFCFFNHISNSTKTSDDFAFFVFFVFKSNRPFLWLFFV